MQLQLVETVTPFDKKRVERAYWDFVIKRPQWRVEKSEATGRVFLTADLTVSAAEADAVRDDWRQAWTKAQMP
jgi:hypothetical protein